MAEPQRRRWCDRPLGPVNFNHLRVVEDPSTVDILACSGNFAEFPNALVTPDLPYGGMPSPVAEALGYPIQTLPQNLVQSFWTPDGRITPTRGVIALFRLTKFPSFHILAVLPILEAETYDRLRVSIIVGKNFIDHYSVMSQNVPLQQVAAAGGTDTFHPGHFPLYLVDDAMLDHDTRMGYVNDWLTGNPPPRSL